MKIEADEIADAGVALDAILDGTVNDDGELGLKVRKLVHATLKRAIEFVRETRSRTKLVRKFEKTGMRRWTSKIAIIETYASRELDYSCLFCGESLDTMGTGRGTGSRIPRSIIDRWERHTTMCACRTLLASQENGVQR